MPIRRRWLVLGMLLIPTGAHADDHKADLFAALCFARGSTLVGFHQAYAVTLKDHEKWSGVSDFSVNFGSNNGSDVTQVPFLVGVRYTPAWLDQQKVVPSGHFLIGGVYTNDGVDNGIDRAFAFGVGLEILPERDKSKEGLGLRLQFDYIVRDGDNENVPRFSVGAVYRFKRPPPTP